MNKTKKNPYILIVDDTLKNIQVLGTTLKKAGYEIIVAQNGLQALKGVERIKPDLILLDIMMPELDGFETCKRFKASSETKDIPIIFLTAKVETEDVIKGFELGAVDYVTKPFNPTELLARVNTHLQLKKAQEQLLESERQLAKSERMAYLGQLVAGIAHEINTPFGVIQSSINQLDKTKTDFAEIHRTIQSLPPDKQTLFFELLQYQSNTNQSLSTREERQYKRDLTTQLETMGIANAPLLASKLAGLGLYENIEWIYPILTDPNAVSVLETALKIHQQDNRVFRIKQAIDQVSKLIFALKKYSNSDFSSGSKSKVPLQENIDTVLTLYHSRLKDKIELVKNYQQVPSIDGYADELIQVWTNLIHNALHAMENQGVLEISLYQDGSNIVVDVIDNGIGIPLDIKDQIFDPFFTTKPPGEGTGLGLEIVKRIVDKHDGTISVNSVPGKTVFTVCLPV